MTHGAHWDDKDVTQLGVLTTATGRCRNIPSSYKCAIAQEARSNNQNASLVTGVVQGLARAQTPKRFRLFKVGVSAAKKLRSRMQRTAKSQLAAAHPESQNFGQRMKAADRYAYLKLCRRIAQGQKRFSLAMDATDIIFKKVLNSTLYLPTVKQALWLPPMDAYGNHWGMFILVVFGF